MASARPSLPYPALVLVTDGLRLRGRRPAIELDHLVREAVLGGVNVVQLREKHLRTAELVELGLRVQAAIAGRALFLVNGDVEAARTLRADGIHLPSNGPTVGDARSSLGEHALISVAVHSVEDAVAAEDNGADMIQLGTAFATLSKPGIVPLGLDGVRTVCAAIRVPVVAIGGITVVNADSVVRAGASGVAVVSAILDATDARAHAGAIRRAIEAAVGRTGS